MLLRAFQRYIGISTHCVKVRNMKDKQVEIRKIVYKECENVIILNTLDYLYGHVLLKLYNALHHIDNHKDAGLIIIIPKMFEWSSLRAVPRFRSSPEA